MIITAGSLKSKKIYSIKNRVLRPTLNKIRQAIFNILLHSLELDKWKKESYMLDAFAGTGIVSFEAISRGIFHSTLIEKDSVIYSVLKENIRNLSIDDNTNTINENFFNLKNLPHKYKLAFLDPPYNEGLLNASIELINDLKILKKKSLIICETKKSFQIKSEFNKYIKHEKCYGNTRLIFLTFN